MNIWANLMAGAAVLIFLSILGLGVYTFNPRRARNVKYAERDDTIIQERVVQQLRVYHPEITKRDRLDRHWFYIGLPISVLAYAICLFAGAKITNNVAALPQATRLTMGVCFTIGALFVFAGITLGLKLGPIRFGRRIHNHPTAPLLGDDVTLPYWLGIVGLCAITISLAIYSWTSFQTTIGSLGGWMTGVFAGCSALVIVNLYLRIKEFEGKETTLLDELQRVCHDGD